MIDQNNNFYLPRTEKTKHPEHRRLLSQDNLRVCFVGGTFIFGVFLKQPNMQRVFYWPFSGVKSLEICWVLLLEFPESIMWICILHTSFDMNHVIVLSCHICFAW